MDDHEFGAGNEEEDEWFILTKALLEERDDIAEAVASFEGDPKHAVSAEGVEWFKKSDTGLRQLRLRLRSRRNFNAWRYLAASASLLLTLNGSSVAAISKA
jgi:hypothetical protein